MAKDFAPLAVEDMDPMFQDLSANEMMSLAAKMERAYNRNYDLEMRGNSAMRKGRRVICKEFNVLCNMIECAEYLKFGF